MAKLKSISIKVEKGERKIYHNDWEEFENRDIEATISIVNETEVFGQKLYPTVEVNRKLPKDLEDKFVELWYEVENRLKQ